MPKNPILPRAYSYLRFSSPEQAKGDSRRRQTALADNYAQTHGLTLDTELNLRDLGVSAYRGDNAGPAGALGAFRQAIRDGLVPTGSFLLVEALDRISRGTHRKAVRILEEIIEAGITVVTLNDGKQWTLTSIDGADFLMAILLFMRGNEESETKAKRLKASWVAKRERAARGEVQTARVPAWIKVTGSATKDARNAKLSLIPDRAKLIKRMFEMFLAGHGKYAIAEKLNFERIPTWGAGTGRRPGAFWHASYVFKILNNPAATGQYTPCIERHEAGKLKRDPQPPIDNYYPRAIDDETFQRVQRLFAARRGTVRSAAVAGILSGGLARCPKCGSSMRRVVKGKKGGVPKLVCAKAKAGAGCKYTLVKLPEIERALVNSAAKLGNPPVPDNDLAAAVAGMRDELIELEGTIESLVDQIERSKSVALSKRLAAREAEADKLRAELKELEQLAVNSESRVVKHRANRLKECLIRLKSEPSQIAAANAALRECLASIVVDYATGHLALNWRHGAQSSIVYKWDFEPVSAAHA